MPLPRPSRALDLHGVEAIAETRRSLDVSMRSSPKNSVPRPSTDDYLRHECTFYGL